MLADAAEHFFPRTSLTRETLARCEALIADGDLDLSIRRRLVDEADDVGAPARRPRGVPTRVKARRPGPTVRTRVHELGAEGERHHEDRLATEEPLEIRLAWPGAQPRRVWVTMRTPGHDFELAAGLAASTRGWSPRHLTPSPTAPTRT